MPRTSTSRTRDWFLIAAMTVSTYGLGLLVVAGLVAAAWHFDKWLILLFAVSGLVFVGAESILERRGRGWTVRAADEPELVGLVEDIASRQGFDHGLLLKLTPALDASLGYERVEGTGTYVLSLGWPYVSLLSQEELGAVVAHEVSHADDLSSVRARLLMSCRSRLADASFPIPGLATVLLDASRDSAISTEFAADAAAADIVGGTLVAQALIRTAQVDEVFDSLVEHWCSVMVDAGEFPSDLYACARTALSEPDVVAWIDSNLAREIVATGPAETHPSRQERLTSLGVLSPAPDRAAPVRVRHHEQIEAWCLNEVFDPAESGLRPGRVVGSPDGRFDADPGRALADARDIGGDTNTRAALRTLVSQIEEGQWHELAHRLEPDVLDLDPEHRPVAEQAVIVSWLGTALVVPLLTAGWHRRSPWLGQLIASPTGEAFDVYSVVETALATGDCATLRRLIDEAALGES